MGRPTPALASPPQPQPPIDLLAPRLAHLVSLHPFTSIPRPAIPLLAEITHHYLGLLTRTAARHAQNSGRASLTPWDIMAALADVGAGGIEELHPAAPAGWMSSENDSRRDWKDRVDAGWTDDQARQQDVAARDTWRQRIQAGWGPKEASATLRFRAVPQSDLDDWQELRLRDEHRVPSTSRKRKRSRPSEPSHSAEAHLPDPSPVESHTTAGAQGNNDDDSDSDAEGSIASEDSASPPPWDSASPETPPPLLPDDGLLYKERLAPLAHWDRGQCEADGHLVEAEHAAISYIPWHLPPLPGQASADAESQGQLSGQSNQAPSVAQELALASASSAVKVELQPEVQLSADSLPGAPKLEADSLGSETQPHQADPAPASAVAPDGTSEPSASSYFSEPIPFSVSALFQDRMGPDSTGQEQSQSASGASPARDLPSIREEEGKGAQHLDAKKQRTSTPALIAALSGLASSGETPIFLPLTNTAGGKVRRRLASLLCQPSRFDPSDVLYSSLPARPSSMPFVPGPSHLVTLPPAGAPGGGAPRFTPIRPKGRPLSLGSSGGELGGASQPTLGYRHPRMASEVARYLLANAPVSSQRSLAGDANGGLGSSGGASQGGDGLAASLGGEATIRPSTLHRSLHVFDPEPLRDEAHVERVFRGVPLGGSSRSGESDSLLRRGDSHYKAAIDSLRISTGDIDAVTASSAAGSGKGAQSGPTAGTVVYTWDWTSRDYTEAAR